MSETNIVKVEKRNEGYCLEKGEEFLRKCKELKDNFSGAIPHLWIIGGNETEVNRVSDAYAQIVLESDLMPRYGKPIFIHKRLRAGVSRWESLQLLQEIDDSQRFPICFSGVCMIQIVGLEDTKRESLEQTLSFLTNYMIENQERMRVILYFTNEVAAKLLERYCHKVNTAIIQYGNWTGKEKVEFVLTELQEKYSMEDDTGNISNNVQQLVAFYERMGGVTSADLSIIADKIFFALQEKDSVLLDEQVRRWIENIDSINLEHTKHRKIGF